MSEDDVLFGYRLPVLDYASRTSVSEACRVCGIGSCALAYSSSPPADLYRESARRTSCGFAAYERLSRELHTGPAQAGAPLDADGG